MRRLTAIVVAVTAVSVVACTSSSTGGSAHPAGTPATSATPVAAPAVWVCRPGGPNTACSTQLDATVVASDATRTRERFVPAAHPKADCFYVYPTVSRAPGNNAPRTAAPEVVDAVHA